VVSDVVLLVVDTKEGLVPSDRAIVQTLRKRNINFVVVANKADGTKLRNLAAEFYELHDVVFPLSAIAGNGTGDLLDYLEEHLSEETTESTRELPEKKSISISLAGIPNVGKSSLLNALIGQDEVIVSDQPHTTREARDIDLTYKGTELTIIDTAGIRKARKLRTFLIKSSADRTLESIEKSDWVIFVIDSTEERWGEQERYILDRVIKSGTNVIFAANKWDLLEGEDRFKEFKERWNRHFGYKPWIPIIPISADTKWHVHKLLDKILELEENRLREIPRSALDRTLKRAVNRRRPQKKKGPQAPYIHGVNQVAVAPPTFEIVISYKDTLADGYVRFLAKQLRHEYEFEGTPLRIFVRPIK